MTRSNYNQKQGQLPIVFNKIITYSILAVWRQLAYWTCYDCIISFESSFKKKQTLISGLHKNNMLQLRQRARLLICQLNNAKAAKFDVCMQKTNFDFGILWDSEISFNIHQIDFIFLNYLWLKANITLMNSYKYSLYLILLFLLFHFFPFYF